MRVFVLGLAAVLAAASFLPLIRHEAWWIRVFDFPRTQIMVSGLAVLGAFFVAWDIGTWYEVLVLGALVAALLLQGFRIARYTPFAPKQVLTASDVDPQTTISLLVANVLMSNRNAAALLRLVEKYDPDILLTLEPDAWWEEQLRVLERDRPHALRKPLENCYGMLLYSRLPLHAPQIRFLIKAGIPSMHMQVQLASGARVWLHCVHPEPPSPTEADESTPRDAELLIVGREVKKRGDAAIVAGDLNDVAWSHTTTLFQKTSGMLDPRKGRGMFNTFHAGIPLMRWPLDHIFHSEHFLLVDMQRLPKFGSDHFAVYARLAYQPEAKSLQDKPQTDASARAQAQAKISKAKE